MPSADEIIVHDLGCRPYGPVLELQRRWQREVIEARGPQGEPARIAHLLLVEHDPPVITISRRRGARQHLIASADELERLGVTVAETDRGGDITYHGPGQLVVYPIIDLNAVGLRLHGYMRFLEQVVIDVLARFDLCGARDPAATGVWVDDRKICAMGVRVSRWVTMHGLALNVTPDLRHFQLIVPCGLAGRAVTSMAAEHADRVPTMDQVKTAMVEGMRAGLTDRAAEGHRC